MGQPVFQARTFDVDHRGELVAMGIGRLYELVSGSLAGMLVGGLPIAAVDAGRIG